MVEQLEYTVKERIEDIEIRLYPEHVIAVVEGMGDNTAFNHLFSYIAGENVSKEKIKMTAPVVSSQKIDMTAPVISSPAFMAFVLPTQFTFDNAPEPTDPKVHLVKKESRLAAVLRFRGRAGENQVQMKTNVLLSGLKKNNRKVKGEPFLMRYNPPFIPGFLRRNEIGIDIE
jgi:hypothetical protein